MVEVLYWNESAVIRALAESLVIGGLPKHAGVPKPAELKTEITALTSYLDFMWHYWELGEVLLEGKVLRFDDCIDVFETLKHEAMTGNPVYVPHDSVSLRVAQDSLDLQFFDKYIKRGLILGNVKAGSGHNCMFKGVQFNMIINMPLYWLKEYQRYHFTDIISSQSTMHCVTQMDIKEHCTDKVEPVIIELINQKVAEFNALPSTEVGARKEAFDYIVANLPSDFHLAMGITMNYLQALSMVKQREHHKLDDWSKDLVPFLKELPFFKLFMLGEWN